MQGFAYLATAIMHLLNQNMAQYTAPLTRLIKVNFISLRSKEIFTYFPEKITTFELSKTMNIRLPKITFQTALIIIVFILGIDQASKIYIKLNYPLSIYGQKAIVDWDFLSCYSLKTRGWLGAQKLTIFSPFLSEDVAKLLLTLFRLAAIVYLGFGCIHS